jgi:hypothetical protein
MGIALGWLAVALGGLAGAPELNSTCPEITYQFTLMELRGLGWREAACRELKTASRRGPVTIWTAPKEFFHTLPAEATKDCHVVMSPRVTAFAQATAHITTRKNQTFITQVEWKEATDELRSTSESVRLGMAATLTGRKLDQGVLVQLVIEDTDVRSVHTINVNTPVRTTHITGKAQAASSGSCASAPDSRCCEASWAPTKDSDTTKTAWHASHEPSSCTNAAETALACPDAPVARQPRHISDRSNWVPAQSVHLQSPEISREEVAGEWLIPHDDVLVVGFGPHTVADKDGKAIVRERVALISAEEIIGSARSTVVVNPSLDSQPMPLPRVVLPVPQAGSTIPMPVPRIPSRSIPQGIHADGTPAELPPLPDDEKAEGTTGQSSEPLPTPQTKKPQTGPGAATIPAPKSTATTGDTKAAKAAFALAQPWLNAAGLLPLPKAGGSLSVPNLQFMLPLKPFSLKLPFSQKLELELVGRIVPDISAGSGADE